MAKKGNGLHITKEQLICLIIQFCDNNTECIKDEVFQKGSINHSKITFEKEGELGVLNITQNIRRTISVWGTGLGGELANYIKLKSEIVVPQITFKASISSDIFNMIIEYLESIEGVTKTTKNATQYAFLNEIGDEIHLTYYPTTCNMMFQGAKWKLFAEVKAIIETMTHKVLKTPDTEVDYAIKESQIIDYINNKLEYDIHSVDEEIKFWIQDSVANIFINKATYNDYGIWSYPILKAVELRMKLLLLAKGITVDIGNFWFEDKAIFKEISKDVRILNNYFINNYSFSSDEINKLEKLCNIYYQNRNSTFHTRLSVGSVILSKDDAINIINDSLRAIGESYV